MSALPEHVRAEIKQQRWEWWSGAVQIGTGVFLGLLAFAFVAWIAVEAYVDLGL
jgi:hypothetical protein